MIDNIKWWARMIPDNEARWRRKGCQQHCNIWTSIIINTYNIQGIYLWRRRIGNNRNTKGSHVRCTRQWCRGLGIFRRIRRSMDAHDGHVIRDQRRKRVKEEWGTRRCYQLRNERSGGVSEKLQRPAVKRGQGSTRPGRADTTGQNRKGQCKETTLLLAWTLRQLW